MSEMRKFNPPIKRDNGGRSSEERSGSFTMASTPTFGSTRKAPAPDLLLTGLLLDAGQLKGVGVTQRAQATVDKVRSRSSCARRGPAALLQLSGCGRLVVVVEVVQLMPPPPLSPC